jgi:hypothetical protein
MRFWSCLEGRAAELVVILANWHRERTEGPPAFLLRHIPCVERRLVEFGGGIYSLHGVALRKHQATNLTGRGRLVFQTPVGWETNSNNASLIVQSRTTADSTLLQTRNSSPKV